MCQLTKAVDGTVAMKKIIPVVGILGVPFLCQVPIKPLLQINFRKKISQGIKIEFDILLTFKTSKIL